MLPDISQIKTSAVRTIKDHFASNPEGCFQLLEEGAMPDRGVLVTPPNIIGWETKIAYKGDWINVLITLTSHFPFRLPRVYFVSPPHQIPHMTPSRDNHICIAERYSTFLDISCPIKLVFESIDRAAKIIVNGLDCINEDQFDFEFQRYWLLGMKEEKFLSVIPPSLNAQLVCFNTFTPPLAGISVLVSKDLSGEARIWLKNLKRKITNVTKGIYLPTTTPLRPPFPQKNYQVYKYFKAALNTINFSKFNKFIGSTWQSTIPVIFSFKRESQEVYGGIILKRKKLSGAKKTICKGFRNSNIPASIQMLSCFGTYDIQKTNVCRVDSARLQSRVGNDNHDQIKNKKVTIIGCGAIGSRVALNLALNGVEQITLIDNDTLSFGNIARHICSMNDIDSNKAVAVGEHLKRRIPHVEVVPLQEDCMDTISSTPNIIQDNHLVISATGDKTFNLMLNESRISPATLYSWTEVYGYSSHSILVLPQLGGCLNCKLDHNLNFKFECVISSQEKILRQEIGCGSVYLPFSSIDSDSAAGYTSRLALCYLKGEIPKSIIWTFYGDLDEATKQGLKLATPITNNFKLVRKQLHKRLGCKICGGIE